MILSRFTIVNMDIVHPCNDRTLFEGVTYGLSPAGYDVRVEFDEKGEKEFESLRPHQFMLASTMERFVMPKNVIGFVKDKSTWARRGLAVQNTVIEPGWRGYLTLELTNHGEKTLMLRKGMGIAQVIFQFIDKQVEYAGKYQDQGKGPIASIHENN